MRNVLVIMILLFNTVILFAQSKEFKATEKQGFLFGVGIGGGVLLEKDSGIDLENYGKISFLNLKLGWMITPETAICLHVPSGGHRENGETRAFEAVLVTAQHWFSKRIWGMGGVGLAMDMPPFYDTENDDPKFYFGTALSAGLGYEILQRKSFVLDIQARCLYGNYEVESVRRQNIAFDILIGFNWY
jgi:hypothetical protein